MLTLMFNLRQGSQLGWGSAVSLSLWVVFGALLLLFVATERRVSQPFVQLRLFAIKHYSLITSVSCAQFLVLISLQLLLSLYLIQLRGLAEGIAGLLILPLASALAIFSPVAGRITDWLGPAAFNHHRHGRRHVDGGQYGFLGYHYPILAYYYNVGYHWAKHELRSFARGSRCIIGGL